MTSAPTATHASSHLPADRVGRWVVLGLWASLLVTAGPVLAEALDSRSRPVQIVASVGLWAGWALALGATLVPRTVTLTFIRVVMPAAVVATAWAVVVGPRDVVAVLALGSALAVTVVVLAAFVGDGFVNGSSYGDERRMPLRPPAALLLGPVPLAWAVCVAGAATGPLLLAAGNLPLGLGALAVGWPGAALSARALHGLARRWLVFVPAGFVVHDSLALAEPLLNTRRSMRRIGPALADTRATDLTAGALGLALQIDLAEPVVVAPAERGRRRRAGTPAPVELSSFLVTPSRPGAVLREARRRRLPVG